MYSFSVKISFWGGFKMFCFELFFRGGKNSFGLKNIRGGRGRGRPKGHLIFLIFIPRRPSGRWRLALLYASHFSSYLCQERLGRLHGRTALSNSLHYPCKQFLADLGLSCPLACPEQCIWSKSGSSSDSNDQSKSFSFSQLGQIIPYQFLGLEEQKHLSSYLYMSHSTFD